MNRAENKSTLSVCLSLAFCLYLNHGFYCGTDFNLIVQQYSIHSFKEIVFCLATLPQGGQRVKYELQLQGWQGSVSCSRTLLEGWCLLFWEIKPGSPLQLPQGFLIFPVKT